MGWKATIDSIDENPVPNATRWLAVTFAGDDPSKTFSRTFKLSAGNITTADEVLAFLAGKTSELDALDSITDDLTSVVGEEITAAAIPASLQAVTMFQCRALLMQQGLLDTVQAAIDQAGGVAQLAWEYSATV